MRMYRQYEGDLDALSLFTRTLRFRWSQLRATAAISKRGSLAFGLYPLLLPYEEDPDSS